MDWFPSVEEFLEIVDSLEVANEFATVPPMEQGVEVQPIVVQNSRAKLRVQTNLTPVNTPTVRASGGAKELMQRIESLEETVSMQFMQLHELYSFILNRLEKYEKIVTQSNPKNS